MKRLVGVRSENKLIHEASAKRDEAYGDRAGKCGRLGSLSRTERFVHVLAKKKGVPGASV